MVSRDRGQVLLVAAVLVAVIFVSLAFVVNAAISTDTASVRGISDVRDDDALRVQEGVRNATQSAIVQADRGGDFGVIMGEMEGQLRAQYAHGDRYLALDSPDYNGGSDTKVTFTYSSQTTTYSATITVNP